MPASDATVDPTSGAPAAKRILLALGSGKAIIADTPSNSCDSDRTLTMLCLCPECAYRYELDDAMMGENVVCPKCDTQFKAESVTPLPRKNRSETEASHSFLALEQSPLLDFLSFLLGFLTFRRMITPIIIQVFFVLSSIIFVTAGGYLCVSGPSHDFFTGKQSYAAPIFGFFLMVGGPLGMRICCEMAILFFRMNETLSDIRNNTTAKPPIPRRP